MKEREKWENKKGETYKFARETRMLKKSLFQAHLDNTRIDGSVTTHETDNMSVETRCVEESSCRTQRFHLVGG